MVGNTRKTPVAGVILAVSLSFLWWPRKDGVYEAKCVYAYWKSQVETNATGNVIQPEGKLSMGAYDDYRRIAEESIADFLSRRTADGNLFHDYFRSCTNSLYGAEDVSNAFASVHFKITGDLVAVVELCANAKSRELSIDVVRFTLMRYLEFVEENDRLRDEKMLAILKHAIAKKRRNGEDVSELDDRLEKAKATLREHHHRITVIASPTATRK